MEGTGVPGWRDCVAMRLRVPRRVQERPLAPGTLTPPDVLHPTRLTLQRGVKALTERAPWKFVVASLASSVVSVSFASCPPLSEAAVGA